MVTIAQTVAFVILGILAAPVTQFVKNAFGNPEGQKAAFVFYGTSFVIALIAIAVTTGFQFDVSSPETFVPQLVNAFLAVIALGTIVYNQFKTQLKTMETPK